MPYSEIDDTGDHELQSSDGDRLRSLFVIVIVFGSACVAFGLINLVG